MKICIFRGTQFFFSNYNFSFFISELNTKKIRLIKAGQNNKYDIYKELKHSACISFWIPKRQAISTDTSFETKMMVKSGAIEIIFKSHEPFQSYLLTGQTG